MKTFYELFLAQYERLLTLLRSIPECPSDLPEPRKVWDNMSLVQTLYTGLAEMLLAGTTYDAVRAHTAHLPFIDAGALARFEQLTTAEQRNQLVRVAAGLYYVYAEALKSNGTDKS